MPGVTHHDFWAIGDIIISRCSAVSTGLAEAGHGSSSYAHVQASKQFSTWAGRPQLYTSIKIIKNEVGCRDDTVPKTVDTRRHCEEE